jgi:hypothetical protein
METASDGAGGEETAVKVASRLLTGVLLAGAVTAAAAPALPARPSASAAPTGPGTAAAAGSLYRQALTTTRSWSVHYVSSSTQTTTSGVKVTLLESGDAGPASGTQSVSFRRGTVSGGITIEVIGSITYVKGDVNGLENLAGLSPLHAAATAGKWIDFATTNVAFAQVVAGVRSHDIARELALTGLLTLGRPRTIHGTAVLAIEGTQGSTGSGSGTRPRAVLYVRAHGRHLPVEEDTVTAKGQPSGTFHVTYSNWGERVRPLAPLAAVSIGPVTTT